MSHQWLPLFYFNDLNYKTSFTLGFRLVRTILVQSVQELNSGQRPVTDLREEKSRDGQCPGRQKQGRICTSTRAKRWQDKRTKRTRRCNKAHEWVTAPIDETYRILFVQNKRKVWQESTSTASPLISWANNRLDTLLITAGESTRYFPFHPYATLRPFIRCKTHWHTLARSFIKRETRVNCFFGA